jgi:hypothetical protein
MTPIVLPLLAFLLSQAPGSVTGVVTNVDTKSPVAGARVLLVKTDSRLADAVLTTADDRGRFVFTNIQTGSYRLLAEHDDYLRGQLSEPLSVAAGEPVPAVTLTLIRTAVISGRVTDEFGEPTGKVYVRALTTRVVAEVRTNDLGEYRLFGLEPGTYLISAERYKAPTIEGAWLMTPTAPCPDCMGEGSGRMGLANTLTTGGFIDPRALTKEIYPAVFYPGTTERNEARPVKIEAGAHLDSIDVRLVVR